MSKSTVLNAEAKTLLGQSIKPKTQVKYNKEWEKFVDYLMPEEAPAGVTECAVVNYLTTLKDKFVPSVLRSIVSALKHRAKELHNVDLDNFSKIGVLLTAHEKQSTHRPRKAKHFEMDDLQIAFETYVCIRT